VVTVINGVVDDGGALDAALTRARAVAAAPAESVQLAKMLLRQPHREAVLRAIDTEAMHRAVRVLPSQNRCRYWLFTGQHAAAGCRVLPQGVMRYLPVARRSYVTPGHGSTLTTTPRPPSVGMLIDISG
jgi:hypothetical protein